MSHTHISDNFLGIVRTSKFKTHVINCIIEFNTCAYEHTIHLFLTIS